MKFSIYKTTQNNKDSKATSQKQLNVISSINLSGLPHSQKEKVFQRTSSCIFTRWSRCGTCSRIILKTKLKHDIPVQQNTIPKQLHSEVKQHIEDLPNKQWAIHLDSVRISSSCCKEKMMAQCLFAAATKSWMKTLSQINIHYQGLKI